MSPLCRGQWGALAPACTPTLVSLAKPLHSGLPVLHVGMAASAQSSKFCACSSPWCCLQSISAAPACSCLRRQRRACRRAAAGALGAAAAGGAIPRFPRPARVVVGIGAACSVAVCPPCPAGSFPGLEGARSPVCGSTEGVQVAWYDLMPFCIDAFFHLKALDKPKSWPSKSRRYSQSPSPCPSHFLELSRAVCRCQFSLSRGKLGQQGGHAAAAWERGHSWGSATFWQAQTPSMLGCSD